MKKLAVIIMMLAAMFVFAACGGTEMSNEEKFEQLKKKSKTYLEEKNDD